MNLMSTWQEATQSSQTQPYASEFRAENAELFDIHLSEACVLIPKFLIDKTFCVFPSVLIDAMPGLLLSRPSMGFPCLVRSSLHLKVVNLHQRRSLVSDRNPYIKVAEEVQEALATQMPVVALETTIYTHGGYICVCIRTYPFLTSSGFPFPENTALASHLESVVRVNGGVPATIGVLNGVARVGLSAEELIELTAAAGKAETRKISRRDLAPILGLVIFSSTYYVSKIRLHLT